MKVRVGFIYALLFAVGLLLWNNALDARREFSQMAHEEPIAQNSASLDCVPWSSAEAVYECTMKAEELGVILEDVEVSPESWQGSMSLRGEMTSLRAYYEWLETDGCFRSILSLNLEADEEKMGVLNIQYNL